MDATVSEAPGIDWALDKGFRLGDWLVRPGANLLERRYWGRLASRVEVEPRPMQLLVALARAGGAVVTREQLRMTVWQRAYISDEVITVAVRALRKALGDDAQNPAYIQTFPGQGYRLVCEAEPLGEGRRSRMLLMAVIAAALVVAFLDFGLDKDASRLPLIDIPANAVFVPGAVPDLRGQDREAFVRARYVVRNGDGRLLEEATLVLDELITHYPGEAGLLEVAANARLLAFRLFGQRRGYLDQANAFLESAAASEPAGPAALGSLAVVRYYRDWDIAGADELFRAALAGDTGDTGDPLNRRRYARFLGEQQRFDEAWRILASLAAPDPESFAAGDEARLLYFEGRFEEAITKLNALLKQRAEPGDGYSLLALNLEALGRYDEAMEAVIRHYEHRAYDAGFIDVLRRSYADGGWKGVNAHFRNFLIGLRARGVPQSSVRIARYALGAGDREEAIERLRQAMEARDPAILSIAVDPAFRELRGLAVFDSLVAEARGSAGG